MSRPRSAFVRSRTTTINAEWHSSRPKTSLGFSRNDDRALPSGLGFDLSGYFRQHGSGTGLTVGINGRPSRDAALQNYVHECRVEALLCELEKEEEVAEEEVWRWEGEHSSHHKPTNTRRLAYTERIPLCWDTLLHEKEVSERCNSGISSWSLLPSQARVPYQRKEKPQTTLFQSRMAATTACREINTPQRTFSDHNEHDETEDEDIMDLRGARY